MSLDSETGARQQAHVDALHRETALLAQEPTVAGDPNLSAFGQPLSYADLMDQLDERGIGRQVIADSIMPENLIGFGGSSSVHRIPGLNDYVLRTDLDLLPEELMPERLERAEAIVPHLNVGQTVAFMGPAELLKKQDGIALGIPDETPATHLAAVQAAAAAPQPAYDHFARSLQTMNAEGVSFDPHAGNVLLTGAARRFNIVDTNQLTFSETKLDGMVRALGHMRRQFSGNLSLDGRLAEDYAAIVQKSETAAASSGLRLSELPLELCSVIR